jgi:hypothetical protein
MDPRSVYFGIERWLSWKIGQDARVRNTSSGFLDAEESRKRGFVTVTPG